MPDAPTFVRAVYPFEVKQFERWLCDAADMADRPGKVGAVALIAEPSGVFVMCFPTMDALRAGLGVRPQ